MNGAGKKTDTRFQNVGLGAYSGVIRRLNADISLKTSRVFAEAMFVSKIGLAELLGMAEQRQGLRQ